MVLPVKSNDVCLSNGTKFMNYVFVTSSPYHYMTCINGVSEIHTCPPGSIFVPRKNCTDIEKHGITIGEYFIKILNLILSKFFLDLFLINFESQDIF